MDRDEICERFLDTVPFSLYPFQEEALLTWFDCDHGMLVTAPTGMGKTLIAEAALFEALTSGRRLYYTTPLIALTDQKFREFQDRAEDWGFHPDEIGLITGNRKVNPDAIVVVVVAEILLNHLLSDRDRFEDVSAVVMDEFHYFNDYERGIVWELSLVFLPLNVRLMLLSATVGNPVEFIHWLRQDHNRDLRLCSTNERRVPLEFTWVGDRLLSEFLPQMNTDDDATCRTPALVFCFMRDECWDVADRLKGLPIITPQVRAEIEEILEEHDLSQGIGPKLKQMLIRGVGVHHAGILPRYKELVEGLFIRKLVPFVVCTETLAAGINLPARSVVLSTLLSGPKGKKKVIPASSAHQMFGRAGRPQFDSQGYVFALAHDDEVKIAKWKEKYEQLDPRSKDPGILRARKQLERKRPTRRNTVQYWTEAQFEALIKAGPAKLSSRSMIPYQVLIYLLCASSDLRDVRRFLSRRFNTEEQVEKFKAQLEHMIGNLAARKFVEVKSENEVDISEDLEGLAVFRSVDPLFGDYLAKMLAYADFQEKIEVLESVLDVPPRVIYQAGYNDLEPGPLQTERILPTMIAMGVKVEMSKPEPVDGEDDFNPWEEEEERPPSFPEMLKIAFEAELPTPENLRVQPKWIVGGLLESQGEFFKFIGSRSLQKNEGVVFRHLLRFVILANEFYTRTEDPDYREMVQRVTDACQEIDPAYTKKFLASEEESRHLLDR